MSQVYFEDVNVDDEVPPVDHTPTEDMALDFFGRDNPTNPAFGDAEAGKRMGVGGALVPGMMKMAWMSSYVAAWAGGESHIRSIRVAFRRPDVAGRAITYAGRVVDKREEDGQGVVELEVAIVAPDGQPSVRGNVQVQLPRRG